MENKRYRDKSHGVRNKLTVRSSENSLFSLPFLVTPLAFQYSKQMCFFGQNERLHAESGRNDGALFEGLGAEEATICDKALEP